MTAAQKLTRMNQIFIGLLTARGIKWTARTSKDYPLDYCECRKSAWVQLETELEETSKGTHANV